MALPIQEDILFNSEVYLGPSRNSTIEMFQENSSRQISVVDVRLGSKYVLRILFVSFCIKIIFAEYCTETLYYSAKSMQISF